MEEMAVMVARAIYLAVTEETVVAEESALAILEAMVEMEVTPYLDIAALTEEMEEMVV